MMKIFPERENVWMRNDIKLLTYERSPKKNLFLLFLINEVKMIFTQNHNGSNSIKRCFWKKLKVKKISTVAIFQFNSYVLTTHIWFTKKLFYDGDDENLAKISMWTPT